MSLHSGERGPPGPPSKNSAQRDPIDAPTRILNETIDVIDRSGEASVRLTQVARRAGVTQGLISYHFGDRDALVAAAQFRRFLDCDAEVLEQLRGRRSSPPDAEETRALLVALLRRPFKDDRDLQRRRVSALGACLYRPILDAQVQQHHAALVDSLRDLVAEGQQLGVVRRDLDPFNIASLIAVIWYGAIALDLDVNAGADLDGSVIPLIESMIFEL